jgi:hypothetical protein
MPKSNKRIAQSTQDGLDTAEQSTPQEVLSDFCDTYRLHEANEIMWDWIATALSKSPSIYDTGRERSNLLFFYEKMKALLEAVYTIDNAQQAKAVPVKQASRKSK